MSFSFFSKEAFFLKGHLMRVSSMIRADQIAERIGAKVNPTEGWEDGVVIYVKPNVPTGLDFDFKGKKPFLDIIDGWGLIPVLNKHPEVPVICCSKVDVESLKRRLKNPLIFIPQHNCNFERFRKPTPTALTTVGAIGTVGAWSYLPPSLDKELSKRGMKMIRFSNFLKREDIVEFYKTIDVQMVWRPYKKRLANPLKIVNASSFGVPTIALDEPYFDEVSDCYIEVNTFEDWLMALDNLRSDPHLYETYRNQCVARSEFYHIDNVAKMYLNLGND